MAEEKVDFEYRQVSKGTSVLIVILVSVVISFVVSFLSYFFIFPQIELKYLYVRVPDVRGLSLNEASKKLKSSKLRYEIVEQVESDNTPVGCVIFQQPLPKTLVRKNTEVMLIVSKGVPVVKIPQVSLKPLDEVKKVILAADLEIGEIKEEFSDTVEKGLVLSTEPNEGVEVKKGTKINLVVSKGKAIVKKVVVPNIVNKSLLEAKKILESKGLKLGNVKKVCDEDKEFDIIISQSPQAGKLIEQGSKVDVIYNAESE
ncbi:MAG: PASTA domain-containing protein [Endomicrobia bacterium]|nr:PASTA domain-containing protein [Endomicrobiia bacterium]MDW8055953.1 PASTA domain-containing protein [Elusimicrobiota bacterium]